MTWIWPKGSTFSGVYLHVKLVPCRKNEWQTWSFCKFSMNVVACSLQRPIPALLSLPGSWCIVPAFLFSVWRCRHPDDLNLTKRVNLQWRVFACEACAMQEKWVANLYIYILSIYCCIVLYSASRFVMWYSLFYFILFKSYWIIHYIVTNADVMSCTMFSAVPLGSATGFIFTRCHWRHQPSTQSSERVRGGRGHSTSLRMAPGCHGMRSCSWSMLLA